MRGWLYRFQQELFRAGPEDLAFVLRITLLVVLVDAALDALPLPG